jgi:hypothetical protein
MIGVSTGTIGASTARGVMTTVGPRVATIVILKSKLLILEAFYYLLILSAFGPRSDRYGYDHRGDRDRRDY